MTDYTDAYLDGVRAAVISMERELTTYFGSLFEPNSNAGIALHVLATKVVTNAELRVEGTA